MATVKPAASVTGILLRSYDGGHSVFRVKQEDGTRKDYYVRHDDLTVTVDEWELAAFYECEDGENYLDHPPSVLGRKYQKDG